jgi:hypothetical protein
VAGQRTVFNLTPVDNSLEARFAQFLDRASDVAAWAKLTMISRFALEYISRAGALRYYYPDFVLRLADDTCLIVETKGQEDLDVALKDRRARRWCRDTTRLAGREWAYEKVEFPRFRGHPSAERVVRSARGWCSCPPRIRSSSAVRRSRCCAAAASRSRSSPPSWVSRRSLRNWSRQIDVDEGNAAVGLSSDEREELRRLRRELRTVTEEREILKKAAAFFAKESGTR